MASTTTPALATLPPTMRAWVRRQRGPVDKALELVSGLPTPALPTGASADVLIRVTHVPLQFNSEILMRVVPSFEFLTGGPYIPELELSGEVVAAGDTAPAELRVPGTHVVAFQNVATALLLGRGVLAEYVRLPGSQVVRIGDAVDLAAASGMHACGSTALKIIRTAGVREGHTVLVNGASGSVGSVLVQLCKLRGARVVGVASGGNEAMVRGLGVDEFVDYRQHDPLPAYLAQQYGDRPFDFVLDCVGSQPLFDGSPAYLKAEGAVVNVGAVDGLLATARSMLLNTFLPTWLGGVPRRYVMFSTPPAHDDGIYLAHLLEEGSVHIAVDSVFALADAVRAYERVATKRARGKVVINVGGD